MAVSKRLRYEILRRDNHTCRYCGATAPDAVLTIDHVVPVALGGQDVPENLVAACKDCNAGKTSVGTTDTVIADVSHEALRFRYAYLIAVEEQQTEDRRIREDAAAWVAQWQAWAQAIYNAEAPLPLDWEESFRRFLALDFDLDQLLDAAWTALHNKRIRRFDAWRYFCGIVYRKADALRERAYRILEADAEMDEVD